MIKIVKALIWWKMRRAAVHVRRASHCMDNVASLKLYLNRLMDRAGGE